MGRPLGSKNRTRISEEERKKRNTKLSMKSQRKRKYGISEEDYINLTVAQEGKCAICGKTDFRGLCVDHNHETGKVRGLLCTGCNAALGLAYDDVDLLEKMITYLKERD